LIKELARVFEEDWAALESAESPDVRKMASLPIGKTAKKMAAIHQEPAGGTGSEGTGERRAATKGKGKMGNREIGQTVRVGMKQASESR
jgi:hypothetical protein